MPELAIRFGLRNIDNRRSSIWKCWSNSGNGKNDVYITNRSIGKAMKVSLHESGSWHIGFDSNYLNKEIEGESRLKSNRFIDMWSRTPEITKGCTLALRIIIVECLDTIPIKEEEKSSIYWISAPPQGKAVEVILFITSPCPDASNWPGRDSMKAQLLGSFQVVDSYRVWLVYHTIDKPTMEERKGTVTIFKSGKDLAQQKRIVRAIIPSQAPDGSRILYECDAEILINS